MRALILGGTGEARDLAQLMYDTGWEVTSSLAGRVKHPKLPVGEVRIGGFGGPAGLTKYLIDSGTTVLVDATHPFAEQISISAAEAARATRLPLIALHRPEWEPQPGDRWIPVPDMDAAAAKAAREFHHIFLTIGRQKLEPFAADGDNSYVIRCVDRPEVPLPSRHHLILDRGPFTVEGEKKLLRDYQVDCLVTKNSGGPQTAAKLHAARELGVPVIMVQRPALPGGKDAYVATTPAKAYRLAQKLG